ncbi:MAG: hypothetical protein QM757_36325 [Paludibaculum sp.]
MLAAFVSIRVATTSNNICSVAFHNGVAIALAPSRTLSLGIAICFPAILTVSLAFWMRSSYRREPPIVDAAPFSFRLKVPLLVPVAVSVAIAIAFTHASSQRPL